jgi:hypothetical protein
VREAFPEAGEYRYVIFHRDSKFNEDVMAFLKATNLKHETSCKGLPADGYVWQIARDYVLPNEFMSLLQLSDSEPEMLLTTHNVNNDGRRGH